MDGSKYIFNKDENSDTLSAPFILVDFNNVTPKEVPTTGEEFLLSVIAERQNIEETTICDVEYTKYNKNQSMFYDEVPLPSTSDDLRPTKEWQNIQVADFSDVRCAISRMVHNNPMIAKKIRKPRIVKNDLKWWFNFFYTHKVSTRCMLAFNIAQVDRGLEILTELIKQTPPGESIEKTLGHWIYAFLSQLNQPLLPDSTSIIRELARECATIRSRIDPENENAKEMVNALNIIICIVGHYFGQRDLADKFE